MTKKETDKWLPSFRDGAWGPGWEEGKCDYISG